MRSEYRWDLTLGELILLIEITIFYSQIYFSCCFGQQGHFMLCWRKLHKLFSIFHALHIATHDLPAPMLIWACFS